MNVLVQEKGELRLQYEGKEPEQSIIENTKAAKLIERFRHPQPSIAIWRNMLIQGDNLYVLKALYNMPEIKGKVRLVYIDPPFATGKEFNGNRHNTVAYRDTLKGAKYIEFLRKRLTLLREILAKDGSIYVHIDWKMSHYVRVIMDEIFKPEHFISDITRIKCNPKNFKRPAYGNIKDTILLYSKEDKYLWRGSSEALSKEDIERLFPKIDEDGRRYVTTPLHAPDETKNGATGQPWKGLKPPKGRHWRYPPERLTVLDNLGQIEWSKTGNPRKKIYAEDAKRRGKKRQDIWEFKDPPYPRYPTEKNLDMLKTIVKASSKKDDIVLDAFLGSATTVIAAEQLGRRWIGIDNSEISSNTSLERLNEYETRRKFEYPYVLYDADT